jgi:hypothetical protein
MNEGNTGEGERRVPAQQAQQPQPSKVLNDQIQSPHLFSEKTGEISENPGKDRLPQRGGSDGGDPANRSPASGAAFDEARFTAGVVKLYEALLKEPIPKEMLRLVDQLGKQERK